MLCEWLLLNDMLHMSKEKFYQPNDETVNTSLENKIESCKEGHLDL